MTFSQYIQEILAQFAQSLMIPAMLVLVFLIALAIFSIASVLVELVTERRHFQVALPEAINAMEKSSYADINDTILRMPLLWAQKSALLTVANNAGIPEDALFALAKAEVNRVTTRYRKIVGRTDLVTKIAPMMGLMCTLIPLGPGIVAMGQGDVSTLSSSLGVAFDGTVAGLVSAVVAMTVSHVRKVWYGRYQSALEALMTTLLEKIETERKAGTSLPVGFKTSDLEPLRQRAKAMAKGEVSIPSASSAGTKGSSVQVSGTPAASDAKDAPKVAGSTSTVGTKGSASDAGSASSASSASTAGAASSTSAAPSGASSASSASSTSTAPSDTGSTSSTSSADKAASTSEKDGQ